RRKLRKCFNLSLINYFTFYKTTFKLQRIILLCKIKKDFSWSNSIFCAECNRCRSCKNFVQLCIISTFSSTTNDGVFQYLKFHASFTKLFTKFSYLSNVQSAIISNDCTRTGSKLLSYYVNY